MVDRIAKIKRGIDTMIRRNPDIEGIISCGSFARGDIDQFSDIDLYIFTKSVNKFIDPAHNQWLEALGNVLSIRIFKDAGGIDKIKMIIDDGLMYDLTIVSVRKFKLLLSYIRLEEIGLSKVIPLSVSRKFRNNINIFYDTIKRGYEIHVDKMRLKDMLNSANRYMVKNNENNADFVITEKEFYRHYNVFWQSCYVASIKLIRGDFYVVILDYDFFLKRELMRMLEWEARLGDDTVDLYYNGYRVRSWGGEKLYFELMETLLSKDLVGMQNCILSMIELYRTHSKTVMKKYGFKQNLEFEYFVIRFIKKIALDALEKENNYRRI